MVHSLNHKIQRLGSPENLKRTLFIQSLSLISTDIVAVTTKVQRLFEAPTDYITFSSIHGWLSEAKAVANWNEVPPKCPDQLVIPSELLRTSFGLTTILIYGGTLEKGIINLHDRPLTDDIINQLLLCGGSVMKKKRKANWHLGWDQILEMTNIHTDLHYGGTEKILKFATTYSTTMLTRHMVHLVVEEIKKAKDSSNNKKVGNDEYHGGELGHVHCMYARHCALHQALPPARAVLKQIFVRFLEKLSPPAPNDKVSTSFPLAKQFCTLVQTVIDRSHSH
ncbi:uncharacterized protein LOC129856842 [Salvelinus fontinalis]|uniref:uncharacterized protein LOC129856842 n=1 Tax=Salvelinus fontinalis TaxID=8038 RepID=UPI0024863D7E|nr:uncharacterized protein LOC129856842 [Salvelinus fontinalis]